MTDTEKKDLYIAAAIGGLGLIVILAYIHSGTITPAENNAADTLQGLEPTTPYNFNIQPYNPKPLITNPNQNIAADNSDDDCCCDGCGISNGAQYNNPTVAQFQTLIQGLQFQPTQRINYTAPDTANVPDTSADFGGSVYGTGTTGRAQNPYSTFFSPSLFGGFAA